MPTGLSISGGSITGTPTVDGQTCEITVTAYNNYDSVGVSKVFTLRVASAPKINTTSPLVRGVYNQPYSVQFTAARSNTNYLGTSSFKWGVASRIKY